MGTQARKAGACQSSPANLRAKIERCRVDADAPVPPIATVVRDAYHVAQRWRYLSVGLGEETAKSSD